MPATEAPAVEVSGLVVRYGAVTAVDKLDVDAYPGEVLAVLGRNGAGKTSTVEAIEGYRRAASGQVRVLGFDPQRPEGHRALTYRVGIMLQGGGVYPAMSPAEVLHLFASYYDRPEDPDVLMARLGLVGTVARTPWRRLSGGEQQRCSLALALVGRPEVVFLDEPTAGVDPHGRRTIRAVLAELRAAGVCVVLTTHELAEAERMADRVVIIERGRVVAAGTLAELTEGAGAEPGVGAGAEPGVGAGAEPGVGAGAGRGAGAEAGIEPSARSRADLGGERPGTAPEIRFGAPRGIDTAALGARLRAAVHEEWPGEYRVEAPGRPAVVAALTAWLAENDLPLTDLRTGRQRLEDVFLRLTASDTETDTETEQGRQ